MHGSSVRFSMGRGPDANAPPVKHKTRGQTSGECGWAPRRAQVGARGRHTFVEGRHPLTLGSSVVRPALIYSSLWPSSGLAFVNLKRKLTGQSDPYSKLMGPTFPFHLHVGIQLALGIPLASHYPIQVEKSEGPGGPFGISTCIRDTTGQSLSYSS